MRQVDKHYYILQETMLPIKRKHLHFSTNLLTLLIIINYFNCCCHDQRQQRQFKSPIGANSTTSSINHNEYDDEHDYRQITQTNPMISPLINTFDSLIGDSSNNKSSLIGQVSSGNLQNLDEHGGDLLAVESVRILNIGKPPAPSVIVPPYATQTINSTSTSINYKQNNITTNNNDNSDNQGPFQLLKLYRAPPAPIFIRHQIQAAPMNQNEHYQATSDTESLLRNRDQQRPQNNSVFALLPSWPSVYVAQRTTTNNNNNHHQHQITSSGPKLNRVQVSNDQLPPANASQLPHWSRNTYLENNGHSNEHNNDDDDKYQKLLRNSSVEYEHQENQENKENQKEVEENLKDNTKQFIQHLEESDMKQLKQLKLATTNKEEEEATQSHDLNWTRLLKQAAENNLMESLMVTNKTIVSLMCKPNEMLIRFKFKRPFYGLIETNLNPLDVCRLSGNGSQYYELHVALDGCGTRQEMPRLFINNLNVRFLDKLNKLKLTDQSVDLLHSNEPEELKTIICSYPMSSMKQAGPVEAKRAQEPRTNQMVDQFDEPPAADSEFVFRNKSFERIIVEASPQDGFKNDDQVQERAQTRRLLFYEPLVLVAGLLLLAFLMVALTTGAYLIDRKRKQYRRRSPPPLNHLTGFGSSSGGSSTSSHIYRASPAQLANQGPLVAPPLIGLASKQPTELSSRHKQTDKESRQQRNISMRPSGRKYADDDQLASQAVISSSSSSSSSGSSSPKRRRHLGLAPLNPSSTYKRRVEQEKSKVNKLSEKQQQQMKKQHDDSLDSGAQSSVTTIEIPYASLKPAKSLTRTLADATTTTTTDTKGDLSKVTNKGESLQTKQENKPNTMGGDEKKTSEARAKPRVIPTTLEPLKRASPLPFGSFRSKLTSPVEYRRLQNILQTFANVAGGQTLRWSKYYTKIMRTFSASERSELNHLIQFDEVFRSNVVDCVDRETFRRKLRNNVKYSGKFKPATWDLIEEIFLDAQMSQIITDAREKFESRMAAAAAATAAEETLSPVGPNEAKPMKQKSESRKPRQDDRDELKRSRTTNYKETDLTLLSSNDSLNEQDQQQQQQQAGRVTRETSARLRSPTREQQQVDSSSGSVPIVRVSQFNSSRTTRDGGTLINIDSVTNFSSTGSFASYTRSRLEQTTSYLEENLLDNSLPFVDDR